MQAILHLKQNQSFKLKRKIMKTVKLYLKA